MNREERNRYEYYFKLFTIEAIRNARIAKGWTQSQLAEAVDVSHEFIRSLESVKGKNSFSAFTLWRISKALQVSLNDLLNFSMNDLGTWVKKTMQD